MIIQVALDAVKVISNRDRKGLMYTGYTGILHSIFVLGSKIIQTAAPAARLTGILI